MPAALPGRPAGRRQRQEIGVGHVRLIILNTYSFFSIPIHETIFESSRHTEEHTKNWSKGAAHFDP
jgi:hypothetical protein